ncbi:hypothetical protein GGR52DRAFT_552387 [Hypoxylon sp. FL1284]|nr:hypothetical protein GGR52DRAFT_552387 [Hypoxylon sp. FL1284]
MLRFLRSRPSTLSLGARVHGAHTPSAQTFQVQRVRIRKRWFKPMNLVMAGCVYYACYRVYMAAVFRPWAESDETTTAAEEAEEDEWPGYAIPLPFTTRMVDSPPYKGTDPEWQTYIKLNKNKELLLNVRADLAELVRKTATMSSSLVRRCGPEMKVGKYWLDIQYPFRPPPGFVRKDLYIEGYNISIVDERVDTVTAIWTSRALFPSVLTMSIWSFSATLMKQNALNLAKLFGYDQSSSPTPPLQQAIERVQQQIKKPTAKPNSQGPGSLPPASAQASDGSSTGSTSTVEKRPAESTPDPESSSAPPSSGVIPIVPDAESSKPKSVRDLPVIKHTKEHTSDAWGAFKGKFAQMWRPIRGVPPRGAIYLSGLVEIETPRAIVTIDCYAWWDPKTKTFDAKTASFRVRTLRMRNQSPAR